ncbi:low temperature requirement protein A [Micromonospora sp. NPDC001898]|uniref:low temperature requirement protein A n=1 Tax=Micromonospora sp. NPDC001898 TaxID=3364221 RepID=UPI0036B6AD08
MSAVRQPGRFVPAAPGSRVTRLELFYDLVFVFAFLNVTTLVAEELKPIALLYGAVALALLWWCWVSFAALGNYLRADQGVVPLIGAVTVAALLVLVLALPEAFSDRPGGPPGPLVFAGSYLAIRGLQVFALVTRSRERRGALWRLSLPVIISITLILAAALLPSAPDWSRLSLLHLGLWVAAVGVEFIMGPRARGSGLTVVSAGHWAERYALIVLIALGESIIALGTGAQLTIGLPLTWPVVVAAVLGVTVIAALWWMYFDVLAPALEQTMHRTRDAAQRLVLARSAYAYLHFPLIAGVILFALGLKRYLTTIAGAQGNPWLARPAGLDDVALFGGVIIYLTALLALEWRAVRRVRPAPVVTLVVFVVGAVAVGKLPATISLALLALICVALVLGGLRSGDPLRRQVRQTVLEEQLATEHDQSEWRRHNL